MTHAPNRPAAVDGPPPIPDLHPDLRVVVTKVERPDAGVIDVFRKFYTGHVLDHLGKHGAMHHEVKPVFPGARLCGPAVTALGADWRLRFTAADLAEPGDVVVVVPGSTEQACFGDVTATRWKAKGLGGVIVDGAVRDVRGLHALGFPTFARRVTPRTFHYPCGVEHGAVNVPVACAGVTVCPGDLVIGDDDGVVVVPRAAVASVAAAVAAYFDREAKKRSAFGEGAAPSGVAAEQLRELGYRFV